MSVESELDRSITRKSCAERGPPGWLSAMSGRGPAYRALYRNALVLFISAFDPILKLTLMFGQSGGDLKRFTRRKALRSRFGAEIHDLADLEFVPNHVFRRQGQPPTFSAARALSIASAS